MRKMKVEYLSTAVLVPYANNARSHSKAQIDQLASAITTYGFNNPILVDEDNNIIAGHGRVLAAEQIGMEQVPCIRLTHLNADQRRAYMLADNRIALNSGWDFDKLATELEHLTKLELDVTTLGFSDFELDNLLGSLHAPTVTIGVNADETGTSNPDPFKPITEPETASGLVTDQDVTETKDELKDQFKDNLEKVEVICPHCGEIFFVAK